MNSRLLKQSLFIATLVTVGGNLLGRFFGYLREALVAKSFGTGAILDTFLIAFTIPEILTFIIFAAIPTGLISSASKIGDDDPGSQASLFWKGMTAFGLILAVITAGLFLFRGSLLAWLAPDLQPELEPLAHKLFGIVTAMVFFRGAEAYFRAWLFKRKHFVVPALSPFILNAVIISSLWFAPADAKIEALAYGWLFASILIFLANAIAALTLVRPPVKRSSSSPSPLLKMTLAVAAIEATFLVYPAIDRFLALKFLGEGEIAALRYALFVSQLPPGILVVTFTAAAFPWITDMAAELEPGKLRLFYRDSVRMVLFVMMPIVAGVLIFSHDIIRVAFQRGAFDNHSVALTGEPLLYYGLGLIFYSLYFHQIRYYYAKQLFRRLGLILTGSLIVKLVASLILIHPLGHNGLALATSIAWLTSFALMSIDLYRVASFSFTDRLPGWLLKCALPLALVTAFWLIFPPLWPATGKFTLLARFARLGGIVLVGLIGYGVASAMLKIPEATRVKESLLSRLGRKR